MEKTGCLIVFESIMNARYKPMAAIHGLEIYTLDLNNNLDANIVANIWARVKSKKQLKIKTAKLIDYIKNKEFTEIYLSNAEGFVSKNIIYQLKRKFPDKMFIALQHGIFSLNYSPLKNIIRRAANNIGFMVTGIYVFGSGFGGIGLGQYYVYSKRERNFLIDKRNWPSEKVKVNLEFLKADIYKEYRCSIGSQEQGTALFLLQGLYFAGLCTEKEEIKLIQDTLMFLSNKYDTVLLKDHPACKGRLDKLNLPGNVMIIETIIEGFQKCGTAYSFFSTSLIDAKVFHIKTIAIMSDILKVDKGIYENFDLKISFEDTIRA